MSHLYPRLRLHQVFGANTDVGKTIFTTALCIASVSLPLTATAGNGEEVYFSSDEQHQRGVKEAMAGGSRRGEHVHYLKPVSTGPMEDSDDDHIAQYASPHSQTTAVRYQHAVSPHLAATLSKPTFDKALAEGHPKLFQHSNTPSDSELVQAVGRWISRKADDPAAVGPQPAVAFVETAGGPHSPCPSGTSQIHLYRPLRLPTILIGDANLGGISTTKSAYESLVMAGHQVDAILLFTEGKGDKWGNADYLVKWGQEVGVPVYGLAGQQGQGLWGGPPKRAASGEQDFANMQQFYQGLVWGRNRVEGDPEQVGGVADVVRQLRTSHWNRIRELDTLAGRTRESCWWPFTQHGLAKSDPDVTVIDSAYGDFFSSFRQTTNTPSNDPPLQQSKLLPLLDASASWWTQCLGHSHPVLAQTAAKAAGRYGHILFPMAANAPALNLAEGLLGRRDRSPNSAGRSEPFPAPGQGWADRVFFSDNGATGIEVALKMAIASARQRFAPPATTDKAQARVEQGRRAGSMAGRTEREWKILGLKGSYHGDTIGAMDACEPSVYSKKVDWYRSRGFWIDPPSVEVRDGSVTVQIPGEIREGATSAPTEEVFPSIQHVYDVETRLKESGGLAAFYRSTIRSWLETLVLEQGERFGALVIEPIVLGAGGMVFVDPLFQRCLVDVVRESEDLFGLTDPPLKSGRGPIRSAREEGEWRGLPVIYDEVFTGLYRLGHATPATVLGAYPDISVLAKILTGGVVPMSVTLASQRIFATFHDEAGSKPDALLHGHSYTAHPVGCEVANATLGILGRMAAEGAWAREKAEWTQVVGGGGGALATSGEVTRTDTDTATATATATQPQLSERARENPIWSFWPQDAVHALSRSARVQSAMAMGTVLVLKLRDASGASGYTSTASTSLLARLRLDASLQQDHPARPAPPMEWTQSADADAGAAAAANGETVTLPMNIHARPLGDVVYFMCSLNTPDEVRNTLVETLCRELGVAR